MTVETQLNYVSYDGDDVAVNFPFTFPVYDADHLFVYSQLISTGVLTLVGAGDYSVTGIGDAEGGAIILDTAAVDGTSVLIARIVPYTQDLDVLNQGGFYPENVELAMDLLEMQIQQLREELSRAVRGQLGESFDPLPPAAERAGLLLGFSEDGTELVVASADMQDAWLLEDGSGVGGGGGGGGTVTDETISDVIGDVLVEGNTLVSITVDDGADEVSIAVDTTVLDERIRDVIGTALVGSVVAVNDAGDIITISIAPNILNVVSAPSVTATFAHHQVNITAQAEGLTLANPTGTAIDGHDILYRITDNGTPRAILYGSKFRAFNEAKPVTTAANKTLYLGVRYNLADDTFDVLGIRSEL